MALLAVPYLVVGYLADENHPVPMWTIVGLATIFLAEFLARLLDAPKRREYLRGHWLDLISSIPLVGGLRAIRILRVLRVGRALRVLFLGRGAASRRSTTESFSFLAPTLFILWIVSAYLYWSFEHGVNASVHGMGDALYWSFLTVTTVGYGNDITPQTTEGRVLAGALIFIGIGLVTYASGKLTTKFLKQDFEKDTSHRLTRIEDQVEQIRDLLTRQVHGGWVGIDAHSARTELATVGAGLDPLVVRPTNGDGGEVAIATLPRTEIIKESEGEA